MRITVSGGSGLIGSRLVAALRERGDEVTVLSRSGSGGSLAWDPLSGPAPAAALEGCEAIVNLAGEPIAQRWSGAVREAIRASRTVGTANLLAGVEALTQRPRVLVSASAVGFYGDRGDELLAEDSAAGEDFLAGVCSAWEEAALAAGALGLRVCVLRTGVVLDRRGGALAKMLPAFRMGIGGPVAGGRQYISWIALADLIALYLAAIDDDRYSGAFNATAPAPVRNAEFSRALGRALHRPAVAPVPAAALRLLYGSMAEIVTASQNAVPARALALGHSFAHASLDDALAAALS
ncbi:MAG TPA: TIGR01777 family oxidoreductase [Solirubrobacteraceae bacterium]|nr:TIGR01777 family oxidoreductase [Solirubrobacteraceae bacterium]